MIMKINPIISSIILSGFVCFLSVSCKEESPEVPVLNTTDVIDITSSSAIAGGNILSDGGSAINARGVCWSVEQLPTISDSKTSDGTGTGNYSSIITDLSPNTKYYLRAYASNSIGTAYGSIISFTTLQESLTVIDIDGNVYNTISIGSQVWLVENLKTTKYRNGDPIQNITGEPWDNLTNGAYCIYDNNDDNLPTYGLLYNWYAVNDSRNICPDGWHLATMEDWETLAYTGLELKEEGTLHWISPNNCYSENSGFTALPGGNCNYDGYFMEQTLMGFWWTADEENTENAWCSIMTNYNYGLSGWVNADKWVGASVRCIQD